jgi:Cys-rich four helix bundle protein (predicted Tat secretion target)
MTDHRSDAGPHAEGHASSTPALRRREILAGAGALAALAAAAPSLAADTSHAGHEQHGKGRYFEAKATKAHPALVKATNECLGTGDVCLAHCFETFRMGDTTMAECAFAVQQMLQVCRAFGYLALNDSKHLKALAPGCIEVCEGCELECRKHEDHQPECKACADACAALIQEARKLLA